MALYKSTKMLSLLALLLLFAAATVSLLQINFFIKHRGGLWFDSPFDNPGGGKVASFKFYFPVIFNVNLLF